VKILKNERTGNKVKLEIEAAVELVKKAEEKALKEAAREIKVPGFRQGKAPANLIERSIDKEALSAHATQNLISDLYPEIIKESKIDPVDYPHIAIVSQGDGKPLVFSIEVDVYPEVKLGKYKGLKATKKTTAVKEEDINKVLTNLQDRFARFEERKEGGAEESDLVDVDMEAKEGDQNFIPLTRKGIRIIVGHGGISPEFDAKLKGSKVGEKKEFSLDFGAGHPVPEIAGKKINFKVKVNKISKKETVPLDDEFAKKVSRLNTLEELKQQITSNLQAEKKQTAEADLSNQLIEQIVKDTQIELPPAMLDREVDIMLDEMAHSLSRSNLTLEAYLQSIRKEESQLREELKTPAKSRVEAKVILREISKDENIKLEESDVEMEFSKMATSSGKTLSEFKESVSEGGRQFVEDYLLRQKALDFVIDKAKVSEEK